MLSYIEYHRRSKQIGDIDPSYQMLRYLCDRFELNMEQRFWLAFLYSTCYCGPTVYYMYNEFPDFENVNVGRLDRWWKANKAKCLFQSDRKWVHSRNQFVPMYESYRDWVADVSKLSAKNVVSESHIEIERNPTQASKFGQLCGSDIYETYRKVFKEAGKIFQMGRFSLFLFTEAVHVVTGFPMKPDTLDLSEAESCRNGMAFALEKLDIMTHGTKQKLTKPNMEYLQSGFEMLVEEENKNGSDVWNLETTLCAYKKYRLGKRYIGYYLDRQADEIRKLQSNVRDGVNWQVLWDYRAETYNINFLVECGAINRMNRWCCL